MVVCLVQLLQKSADVWWTCGHSKDLVELVRRSLAAHGYTDEQIAASLRCQDPRDPREVELECIVDELNNTLRERTEDMARFVDNLDEVRGEAQLLLDEWTADDNDDGAADEPAEVAE